MTSGGIPIKYAFSGSYHMDNQSFSPPRNSERQCRTSILKTAQLWSKEAGIFTQWPSLVIGWGCSKIINSMALCMPAASNQPQRAPSQWNADTCNWKSGKTLNAEGNMDRPSTASATEESMDIVVTKLDQNLKSWFRHFWYSLTKN